MSSPKTKAKPAKAEPQPQPQTATMAIDPADKTTRSLGVELLLSEPFPAATIKWKPQSVKNNRCLAVAFLDARIVMDRLDSAVGTANWADDYTLMPDGTVMCALSIKIAGEWVTKRDVGSPSEQPDGGDRMKAAFSDALKRAAVKFGVGRYIYKLPMTWVDYDPQKRRIPQPPGLPDWALPAKPTAGAVGYADPDDVEEPPTPDVRTDAVKRVSPLAATEATKRGWDVDQWREFFMAAFASCEKADDVNALLPNLKLIADADLKGEVWAFICSEVKSVFPYDAQARRFYDKKKGGKADGDAEGEAHY